MYCHPRCIPMELTHGIMYSSLPDKGDPSHTSYTLSDEDKASITDNNYAVLNLALDWTKTEPTMFLPYFFFGFFLTSSSNLICLSFLGSS